jgi:hypothetical protein
MAIINITNHDLIKMMDEVWEGNRYKQILNGINKEYDPDNQVQQDQIKIIKQKIYGMETFYHELSGKIGKYVNLTCIDCMANRRFPIACADIECQTEKVQEWSKKK